MSRHVSRHSEARQRRDHKRLPVVVFSALALLLGACGGGSPQSSPPAPTNGAVPDEAATETAGDAAAGSEVLLENIAFKPATLEVAVGTEVTWTNADEGVPHTATSGKPNKADGVFDGDMADAGDTFSFTFDEPGTYPYFCEIHPSMTGEITAK